MQKRLLLPLIFFFFSVKLFAQENDLSVIAYYSGGPEQLEKYPVEELTHIIFCFGHLEGNQLNIGSSNATIKKMVDLKKRNPQLKVILSLGGWGGCKTCSDVFSSASDREAFAKSVKRISEKYKTDGIDLDWEYPAILGFPSHAFKPADKENFTELIMQLRKTLGKKFEISFAAGGFKDYIDSSVEWKKVMPLVDRVNLMSYDLVNGYATVSGHHTPLYSTSKQERSADKAISLLLDAGVPADKIVIGAAFYARLWQNENTSDDGLYQPSKFKKSISYKSFDEELSKENGYDYYWDEEAQAPYSYNAEKKIFATYDNKRSIELKTKYAMQHNLDGIMFWQLGLDTYDNGLLGEIYKVKENYKSGK
jgi:chitinase